MFMYHVTLWNMMIRCYVSMYLCILSTDWSKLRLEPFLLVLWFPTNDVQTKSPITVSSLVRSWFGVFIVYCCVAIYNSSTTYPTAIILVTLHIIALLKFHKGNLINPIVLLYRNRSGIIIVSDSDNCAEIPSLQSSFVLAFYCPPTVLLLHHYTSVQLLHHYPSLVCMLSLLQPHSVSAAISRKLSDMLMHGVRVRRIVFRLLSTYGCLQFRAVAPGAGSVLAWPHQATGVPRGVPVPGRHQQRTGEPAPGSVLAYGQVNWLPCC